MDSNLHLVKFLDIMFVCILMLVLVTQVDCDGPYPALTFYHNINSLINIPGKIEKNDEIIRGSIALACPAQTPEEQAFDSKSFGKNSLFVKKVYELWTNLRTVSYKICQNRYRMSICYRKSTREFLFGYEVYYEKFEFLDIRPNNYAECDYISNAFSWRLPFIKETKPKLQFNKNRPLRFIWILWFTLKFDGKLMRPKEVLYTVSEATETGITCKDYDLGKEIYENKKIDTKSLYENQSGIFENVAIPQFTNNLQKSICNQGNQCLTKWSLIPAEEFRYRNPEPTNISCSDLTTVPIWTSLKQNLHKLDIFLYALSRIISEDLQVTAGVHGNLELRENTTNKKQKSIRLGKNGEITVPNVIYKIVQCDVLSRDIDDENGQLISVTKAIIIVFSNDPYFNPKNAFCAMKNCEEWGWKEIYEHTPSMGSSNYIFCCPRSKETLKSLGMKFQSEEVTPLDLTNFPLYDKKSNAITFKSIEQDVVDEMGKLLKDNKDSDDDYIDDEISKDK